MTIVWMLMAYAMGASADQGLKIPSETARKAKELDSLFDKVASASSGKSAKFEAESPLRRTSVSPPPQLETSARVGISLQSLMQMRVPGGWNAAETASLGKQGNFDYTRFEIDLEKKRKLALNIWGHSEHEGPRNGKNENNGGVGLRFYYDDDSFVSGDFVRNTVRGSTRIFSWGHEWELAKFWGYRWSWVSTLSYIEYQIPGKGVVTVPLVPIPGMSLKSGDWSVNGTLLRDGKKNTVVIGFLSWHF